MVSYAQMSDDTVTVEARFAGTSAALSTASYIPITDGGTLQANAQQWVQIRITLSRAVASNTKPQPMGVWGTGAGATYPRRFAGPEVGSVNMLYDAIAMTKVMRHGEWFDAKNTRRSLAW
jgi:hypothetical protein